MKPREIVRNQSVIPRSLVFGHAGPGGLSLIFQSQRHFFAVSALTDIRSGATPAVTGNPELCCRSTPQFPADTL